MSWSEWDIQHAPDEEIAELHVDDAIRMGAQSGLFFNRFFLPKSFTLPFCQVHSELVNILDNRNWDKKAVQVFRDSGKTTLARASALKRVCYGTLHTGLIVSETRDHSKKTISWIAKRAKDRKSPLHQAFGLSIGDLDNRHEVIIKNPFAETESYLTAQGMTGQLRGLNLDDYRPDYIMCDDPCNEENTATPEQRQKINSLFFGALYNSLCARSINEYSEIVLLQTILAKEDLIDLALKDSSFLRMSRSVFDHNGESVWPEKWSTEELVKAKQGFIDRNQLYIWLREKEGRLQDASQAAFKTEWLDVFQDTYSTVPDNAVYFIGVDPVPPPKDGDFAKNLHKKDHEVWTVLALDPQTWNIYVVESRRMKGHQPDWSVNTMVELIGKYRPLAIGVETIASQRVLAWVLRQAQQKTRNFTRIHEVEDRRRKFNRIIDEITGLASNGKLHVRSSLQSLIEQYGDYPQVNHDDDLDSLAIALITIQDCFGGDVGEHLTTIDESRIEPLPDFEEGYIDAYR